MPSNNGHQGAANNQTMNISTISEIDDIITNDTSIQKMTKSSSNIFDLYMQNRSIGEPYYSVYMIRPSAVSICLYTIVVLVATIGNSLVVASLFKSKKLRTSARNILIGLLASSDLLLCMTMPFTAIDGLTKYWPFGKKSEFFCRAFKTMPQTAVYMSGFVVIAIAADRYQLIVNSTGQQLTVHEVGILVPAFILLAVVFSCPIWLYTKLIVPSSLEQEELGPWSEISYCVEDWRFAEDQVEDGERRIYYSVFSLVVQYAIPFISIGLIYSKIYFFLKRHRMMRQECPQDRQKARRTNKMLFSISLLYSTSWFSLNLINVCLDAKNDLFENLETVIVVYVFCHLIGMCSACINPIIYAYWNETFREEFISIGKAIKSLFFDIHLLFIKKQNTDDHHNNIELEDSPRIKTKDLVTAQQSPPQHTTIKMCHLQSHLIPREAQIISYPK